jgi:hypothetical protein
MAAALRFPLRSPGGTIVHLRKAEQAELQSAYVSFRDAVDAANYLLTDGTVTRARYDAANEAGLHLVKTQERLGVHVIHMVNACHGLRPDDPRIVG